MTAEQLRALLATPELLTDARDQLRVAEQLRERWPADLVAAATEQAALRTRGSVKFSRAAQMLFTRAGLEQSSGERLARHRAARFAEVEGLVLDLCCGIGGDLAAIGAIASRVVGVDRDEAHALLARHNAGCYGVGAETVAADVRDVQVEHAVAVFVDPARRAPRDSTGGRGGMSPALDWCLALPVPRIAIKAAPGLDLAGVPAGWEVEFVAVGRELKEAALWSPAWARSARKATVLPTAGSRGEVAELVPDPAATPAPVRPPGRFLLDPSPAVTRAGAVADLAGMLGAWQIDPMIAFLSADIAMPTPFGRCLLVEASLPFAVKPLAAELRRLDIGAIDLRRRGLAGDVDDLRRRLRPSGARRATVMLTRVVNRPWALVCTDLVSA